MAQYNVLKTFYRTVGSSDQRLIEKETQTQEKLYLDTSFYLLKRRSDLFFGKKPHSHEKLHDELDLLARVDHPHVLSIVELHVRYGIVSRYFPGSTLSSVNLIAIENLGEWFAEFTSAVDALRRASVLDKIDLHASNVLVQLDEQTITDWLIVDFERCDCASTRTAHFIRSLSEVVDETLDARRLVSGALPESNE